jgi:hypothetical protein
VRPPGNARLEARRGARLARTVAFAAALSSAHAWPAAAQSPPPSAASPAPGISVASPAPAASVASPAPAATASSYDGTWFVVLTCPVAPDGALGYTYRFEATIARGYLHGEHGTREKASWLSLDGPIAADGSATLAANGFTGRPDYSVGRVNSRTPYGYHVSAHFDAKRGTGTRLELRPCTLQFQKTS